MKKIAISLGALALCTTAAIAQDTAPDPAAGKTLWEGNATQCKNCHGLKGEGAFGPDLANMAAYFASLPKVAATGPWRIPLSDAMPHGQQVAAAVGCAQCHGPTL